MKDFKFNLQSLLTLRTYEQEKALSAWVKAIQEVKNIEKHCEAYRLQFQDWTEFRRKQQREVIQAAILLRNDQMAFELYKLWKAGEKLKKNAQERAEDAFKKWREIQRKQEVLIRLKERAHTRWNKEMEFQEQKQIDERATFIASWTQHLISKNSLA